MSLLLGLEDAVAAHGLEDSTPADPRDRVLSHHLLGGNVALRLGLRWHPGSVFVELRLWRRLRTNRVLLGVPARWNPASGRLRFKPDQVEQVITALRGAVADLEGVVDAPGGRESPEASR